MQRKLGPLHKFDRNIDACGQKHKDSTCSSSSSTRSGLFARLEDNSQRKSKQDRIEDLCFSKHCLVHGWLARTLGCFVSLFNVNYLLTYLVL